MCDHVCVSGVYNCVCVSGVYKCVCMGSGCRLCVRVHTFTCAGTGSPADAFKDGRGHELWNAGGL